MPDEARVETKDMVCPVHKKALEKPSCLATVPGSNIVRK